MSIVQDGTAPASACHDDGPPEGERRPGFNAQLAFLVGSTGLQSLSNGVAAFVATWVMGAHGRGVMVIGIAVAGIAALIGGLGAGSAYRALLPARTTPEARRSLAAAYTLSFGLGSALAALLTVGTLWLTQRAAGPELGSPRFLAAAAAWTVAQVVTTRIVEAWFADGRFRRGGGAAASMAFGGLVAVVTTAFAAPSAANLMFAQTAGLMLVGAGEALGLRRAQLIAFERPTATDLGALLRLGFAQFGLVVGLAIALRLDRYVLGLVAGPAVVGVYSLAATLSEMPRLIPLAVGQMYLRDVALGRGGPALRRATGRALLGALATAMVVILAGLVLIVPVFGPEFSAARPLVVVLCLAEVLFAPYAVASSGLLGGGWRRGVCLLGLISTVGAVVVYGVGGTLGGMGGAAIGCVLLYALLSGVARRMLRNRLSTQPLTPALDPVSPAGNDPRAVRTPPAPAVPTRASGVSIRTHRPGRIIVGVPAPRRPDAGTAQAQPIIPSGRAPRTDVSSWFISGAVITVVTVLAAGLNPLFFHWFVIPTALCGLITGAEAADWARGRLQVLEPRALVGLFGLHMTYGVPMLHVAWQTWPRYVTPALDWRGSLGILGWINFAGLVLYRILVARPITDSRRGSEIDARKFLSLAPCAVLIAFVATFVVLRRAGGIAGYLANVSSPDQVSTALAGTGWLLVVSESWPLIIFTALVISRRAAYRGQPASVVRLFVVFALAQFLVGGLRGDRSNTLWPLLIGLGVINLLVVRIRRTVLVAGMAATVVFVWLYGFYKGAGTDALGLLDGTTNTSQLSEQTGRSFQRDILEDFGRAGIQAVVIDRETRRLAGPPAQGSTYAAAVQDLLLPKNDRVLFEGKRPVGMRVQYGNYGAGAGIVPARIFGLTGEAIMNFGLFLAPLLFVPLALWVRFCTRIYRSATRGSVIAGVMAPCLAVSCILALGSDFDNVLWFLLKQAAPIGALLWIARIPVRDRVPRLRSGIAAVRALHGPESRRRGHLDRVGLDRYAGIS